MIANRHSIVVTLNRNLIGAVGFPVSSVSDVVTFVRREL